MNILFDVLIRTPDLYAKCSPEERAVIDTIGNFVYDRLIVLKDEMDYQELNDEKSKGVLIELKRKRISAVNYTPDLEKKILSSFTPQDIQYMWSSVDTALQNLMN